MLQLWGGNDEARHHERAVNMPCTVGVGAFLDFVGSPTCRWANEIELTATHCVRVYSCY